MIKATCLVLILAPLCWVTMVGCTKTSMPEGDMPDGKIVLSFDDTSIDNWYDNLSLLDSLNIKATFYISSYHSLKHRQVEKLRVLQAHGNEIAYHTSNHSDLLKMYTRNSMRYVVDNEIKPDLKLMMDDGFKPENFAYPFGQRDALLDQQLFVFFKSVRAVSNVKNYNRSFLQGPGCWKLLYAADIDQNSKFTEEQMDKMASEAQYNHNCVFFYAHVINNPACKYYISKDRLRFLGSLAKKYNLEFITTREIIK